MDDTPKKDPFAEPEPVAARKQPKMGRGILLAFAAVVVAFLAGFLWQYFEASGVRSRLESTEQELRVERMRVQLAQAAIAAQSGDFESARQQMSVLFTNLEERTASLPDDVQAVATGFLTMRDEVITGLSRSNPEYADVLFGMLDRLRAAAESPAAASQGPGPAGEGDPVPVPAGAEGEDALDAERDTVGG